MATSKNRRNLGHSRLPWLRTAPRRAPPGRIMGLSRREREERKRSSTRHGVHRSIGGCFFRAPVSPECLLVPVLPRPMTVGSRHGRRARCRVLRPPVHAPVDGAPVAEPGGQPPPLQPCSPTDGVASRRTLPCCAGRCFATHDSTLPWFPSADTTVPMAGTGPKRGRRARRRDTSVAPRRSATAAAGRCRRAPPRP